MAYKPMRTTIFTFLGVFASSIAAAQTKMGTG